MFFLLRKEKDILPLFRRAPLLPAVRFELLVPFATIGFYKNHFWRPLTREGFPFPEDGLFRLYVRLLCVTFWRQV